MPRRKRPAAGAAPPGTTLPALDIRPEGVYRPEQIRAAPGLRASSLRTEWRHGRLRIVRRCGRNYLLGRDVLAWLAAGEVPPPTRHTAG